MRDRKARQRWVGLACRHIVIRVRHFGGGEIRRADRDPDQVQAAPDEGREKLHRSRALRASQLVMEEPCRRDGHRLAEAGDRLTARRVVDVQRRQPEPSPGKAQAEHGGELPGS